MKKEDIEYWLEQKCVEPGCYNYHVKGYICCAPHLGWSSSRLPEEIIIELRAAGK